MAGSVASRSVTPLYVFDFGMHGDITSGDHYNYDCFDEYVEHGPEQREFAAFPNHLHAGDPAPEITGVLLDDRSRVALSETWRRRTVVVEFGSFT